MALVNRANIRALESGVRTSIEQSHGQHNHEYAPVAENRAKRKRTATHERKTQQASSVDQRQACTVESQVLE